MAAVLLLVFGAKRLPEMGRSLGKGMREFKDSVSGLSSEADEQAPLAVNPAPPSQQNAASRDHDTISS